MLPTGQNELEDIGKEVLENVVLCSVEPSKGRAWADWSTNWFIQTSSGPETPVGQALECIIGKPYFLQARTNEYSKVGFDFHGIKYKMKS